MTVDVIYSSSSFSNLTTLSLMNGTLTISQTGIKGLLSGFALGIFFLCLLWVYYFVENSRRDRKYGVATAISQDEELEEDLSNKTDREIPHFRYVT
jgi:hypothetical protein